MCLAATLGTTYADVASQKPQSRATKCNEKVFFQIFTEISNYDQVQAPVVFRLVGNFALLGFECSDQPVGRGRSRWQASIQNPAQWRSYYGFLLGRLYGRRRCPAYGPGQSDGESVGRG